VKTKYYARLATTAIQGFTSSILLFCIAWMDVLAINSPHIHSFYFISSREQYRLEDKSHIDALQNRNQW